MASWRALDPTSPLRVTAGGAELTIVDGTVRWITAAGVETVRGIYGAVRDPSWATIQPVFTDYEGETGEDSFTVRFRAECMREAGGIDVVWQGTISGSPDGTVTFVFEGECRSAFMTPRIGLCVLHPPRLAGQAVTVETLFGTLDARFPDLITQYMPFSNMVAIRHDVDMGHETVIGFEGDIFETEDQRAFTDASYKTFSRPLEMPRPFKVEVGTVVRQAVTVQHPRLGSRARGGTVHPAEGPVSMRIGGASGAAMPAIGSCLPPADLTPDEAVLAAVRELGLAHVRASLDVDAPDAVEAPERAASLAGALGSALEVLLVGPAESPGLDVAVTSLARSGVPLARLMAVDPAGNTTTAALAGGVRETMAAAGVSAPFVGGSRAYLYQLISRGVAGDLVDIVSFPTNPQVHAFDEASMVETLEALPACVRTASALAGGKPVAVAPVSLRPLFNPDLIGPEAPPPPGELPWRYDVRQVTPFAAAWTLGCVAAFAAAGVEALTLHEAAGWGGLVAARHASLPEMPAAPGTILPVGRVVQALAGLSGLPLVEVQAPASIHALGVRPARGDVRVLLANLGSQRRRVEIDGAWRLSEAALLSTEGAGSAWTALDAASGSLELAPNGVASLLISAA